MYIVQWKSLSGKTCKLSIDNDSNSVVEFTPGAKPFVTEMDTDEDIFTPIRTQSGYVTIMLDAIGSITQMVGSSPFNRPVTLTVNNVVRWKGFLACETFTQPFDKPPFEVELPVVSPVEVLRGLYPSSALADLGVKRIGGVLAAMNAALGAPFTEFVFPNLSNPTTTLYYYINMANYATVNDDNTGHTMDSWYDILEDICKLFGWQCVEIGTSLVFLTADTNTTLTSGGTSYEYVKYTYVQMQSIGNGTSVSPTIIAKATSDLTIYGTDHNRDFLAGYQEVIVEGDMNEIEDTIWSLDITGKCTYVDGVEKVLDHDGRDYFVRDYTNGGGVEVFNNVPSNKDTHNLKFENSSYYAEGAEDYYGGSVTNERLKKVREGDADFVSRLIVRAKDLTAIYRCAIIHTNVFYEAMPVNTDGYFYIDSGIQAADIANDWFGEDGSEVEYVFMAIKIGNYYYSESGWSTVLSVHGCYVQDGKISDRRFHAPPTNSGIKGEIVLEIYVIENTDPQSSGNKYVAFEGLKISFKRSWKVVGLSSERKKTNKATVKRTNGFTEKWEQSCGLTLARRTNIPMSLGAVLNENKQYPSSLYSSAYPEDALADRVMSYYETSQMRYSMVVQSSGQMLEPWKHWRLWPWDSGHICLAQSIDWQNEEITGKFY